MKKMVEELVVHGVLLVFMAVLFLESRSFPEMNIGGQLGAAWWPQIVLGLGIILTACSAVVAVRGAMHEEGSAALIKGYELKSLVVSSAIFSAFLILLPTVGFLGAVPVLMFGFIWQLGSRNWVMMIAVAIIASPVFAYVFGSFMEVPLPRGAGWARMLSYYFY